MKSKKIYLASDGSYLNNTPIGGYAIFNSKEEQLYSKRLFVNMFHSSRQIVGETEAFVRGISRVLTIIEKDHEKDPSTELYTVEEIYDYKGVVEWYAGRWKAKKGASMRYRDQVINIKRRINKIEDDKGIKINLIFTHQKSHTGGTSFRAKANAIADRVCSKGGTSKDLTINE